MKNSLLNRRVRASSKPVNKDRIRLVDHHYKIDKQSRSLLPGLPLHDKDLARDIHDFFNLIVLVPIIVLNVICWDWDQLLDPTIAFWKAWHGDYYDAFFMMTVAYFIVDLVWVCVFPKCVKSPSTIVQHHLAVLIYIMIPHLIPDLRWAMGACMSVEVNTWFLIARRVFNKQGFGPWTIGLPYLFSVRVKLISIFFYTTWIAARIVIFPSMLVVYYQMYRDPAAFQLQGSSHIMLLVMAIHSIFVFLNFRWTIDLVNSKRTQWRSKGKTKVSSGL